MSVYVDLQLLSQEQIQRWDSVLTVKSNVNPKSKFQQQVCIQTYDAFYHQSKRYVCLPFSFYYHHVQRVTKLQMYKQIQFKMKFNGSLLPRQLAIKDETLEILNRTGSILLCLHTGFGKTIFTLYLASRIGMKCIILCHRAIIIQQWLDSIHKYLPAARTYVLNASDYKNNQDINAFEDVDIMICNVINVPKLHRNLYAAFGCVIVDEVHTICTNQFSKSLFLLSPSFLIGLSATPFRSDGMDQLLELYLGPEIVYRPMYRLFNAYRLNTGFKPNVEMTADNQLNWNSVLESQSTNQARNQLICQLIQYFGQRNILVLVKRKEHALQLKQMLIDVGEDADSFIHTAKTVNYSCRILIATYSKGGVGFDHPKLDMLITGADVEENFMQYLGRVFRRDEIMPIYIDLRDEMSILIKHSQTRLKICKEVGGQIHEFLKVFTAFTFYQPYLSLQSSTK